MGVKRLTFSRKMSKMKTMKWQKNVILDRKFEIKHGLQEVKVAQKELFCSRTRYFMVHFEAKHFNTFG
jgi:hypothetical protein